MAETADFNPADYGWRGHDFKDAKKAYDAHVGRGYADAAAKGVDPSSLIPTSIQTSSMSPLVIACDVTGSMGQWPAVIFSKLPYLEIEGKEYLGKNMEISFAAIGDAPMGDTYPLQVRQFSKGTDLAAQLQGLIIEGKGGGDKCESYELAALYYSRNAKLINANKPIFIFIGDEGLHAYVERHHGKACNIEFGQGEPRLDTTAIFAELTRKFAVYVIRKPYEPSHEPSIQKQWVELIGEEHVVHLPGPERVIDVIFGILAKETNRIDYFKKELEGRQKPDQVATVYKSLATVHTSTAKPKKGKSVMVGLAEGKKTKGLLDK